MKKSNRVTITPRGQLFLALDRAYQLYTALEDENQNLRRSLAAFKANATRRAKR